MVSGVLSVELPAGAAPSTAPALSLARIPVTAKIVLDPAVLGGGGVHSSTFGARFIPIAFPIACSVMGGRAKAWCLRITRRSVSRSLLWDMMDLWVESVTRNGSRLS